jgi:peroxiredoxin Q/BCP
LRDNVERFKELDCVILGASFDTPAENREFAEAQNFPYQLLSDVDRTVGPAYDVQRPSEEQYSEFARRYSFLIDPDGVIRQTYVVTDVAKHASEVLSDLRALQA